MSSTRIAAVFLSLSLLLPLFPVHAQETGTGATQTGSTFPSPEELEEQREHEARVLRAAGFRDGLKKQANAEGEIRRQQTLLRTKRSSINAECRGGLRRATKNEALEMMLRCYRSQLSLEETFLRRERTFLATTVGVSEDARLIALQRLDLLRDAIATIVEGIDSGVYQNAEDLQETKRQLFERYRVTFVQAVAILRSERLLAWIAHSILKMEARRDEETTLFPPDGRPTVWNEAIGCLDAEEQPLKDLAYVSDTRVLLQGLEQATARLRLCMEKIRAIPSAPPDTTEKPDLINGLPAQFQKRRK